MTDSADKDPDGMRRPDAGEDEGAGEGGVAGQKPYHMHSRLIHGDAVSPHWDYSHHVVPPISSSATYRLDSAGRGAQGFMQFGTQTEREHEILIYDRLHEPTSEMLEDRLCEAEGGECAVSFATGMAAISAALGVIARSGDHVIAHQCLYGCTASLLRNWYPRLGVDVSFVDMTDLGSIERAIRPTTRAVYLESPVNPTLDVIDLAGVAEVVRKANAGRGADERIYSVCDNTFATPVCQRPLEHGIDVVAHSLTKGIGGFGTDMGGMVIAPCNLRPKLLLYRKDFGAALSPKAAWPPLVYGLPTLPLRMAKMQDSAARIAHFLREQPLVAKVRYPGLESDPHHALALKQMRGYDGRFMPGSMVYLTLREEPGSSARAEAFCDYAADHSYCMTLAVSLGQIKTLIESPRSMTHSALPPEEQVRVGIEPGGVRLSIGIEDPEDLLRDLQACLDHA